MSAPKDLLYTKEHVWARIDGNFATIGITFYAQSHLSDITFVDLPKSGEVLRRFDKMVVVESVKSVSEIQSPLSGKIIKINDSLVHKPELVNLSCYNDGWFVIIALSDKAEVAALMKPEEYDAFLVTISE